MFSSISFGNEISNTNKYTIKLPNIERVSNKINFEEIRAAADSKSLRHRFSNNETFKKFQSNKSKESQTGPAVRNDVKTLKKHEEILKKSNYLNLYKIITKSIKKNDL